MTNFDQTIGPAELAASALFSAAGQLLRTGSALNELGAQWAALAEACEHRDADAAAAAEAALHAMDYAALAKMGEALAFIGEKLPLTMELVSNQLNAAAVEGVQVG